MDDRYSLLLVRTIRLGCLLGIAATIYLLFGLAGFVRNGLLNLTVVAVLVLGAAFFLANFFAIPRETNWLGRTIWATILVFFIIEVILGLLPPISRDELTHHLAIPRLYAETGRIIEVPIAPYAYYPMLLDMLYTPWVYWRLDFVPKWIHALFAYLTGLLLYAYLGRRMSSEYGLLGFFLFISTPAITRLSHWGYVDLGITFFTTAALLALLRWREERRALGWLCLGALSLGFALATKPNGMVAGLVICFLFVLAIVHPPRKPAKWIGREMLLFGGLTLLPYSPWLAKNWFQTGNPFFPLLGNIFAAHRSVPGEAVGFGDLGIFAKRELLYGENIWQIIGLPLRVFLSGQDDSPQFFDGVLTLVLIFFLPWAFKGKWLDEKKILTGFSLLFFLYALFLVDLRIRYILLIVPPLVVLSVYGIFNAYLRIKRPAYLIAILVFFAAWHGTYLWRYFNAAEPFGYLWGGESREAYLIRMLPEYAAFRYINRESPPASKIYLLFIGRRAYYCERDYFHDSGDLPGALLGVVRAAKGPEQIAQSLRRMNLTHLMMREDLLAAFLTNNLAAEQARLWYHFATTRLKLAFRGGGYAVYQLDG